MVLKAAWGCSNQRAHSLLCEGVVLPACTKGLASPSHPLHTSHNCPTTPTHTHTHTHTPSLHHPRVVLLSTVITVCSSSPVLLHAGASSPQGSRQHTCGSSIISTCTPSNEHRSSSTSTLTSRSDRRAALLCLDTHSYPLQTSKVIIQLPPLEHTLAQQQSACDHAIAIATTSEGPCCSAGTVTYPWRMYH